MEIKELTRDWVIDLENRIATSGENVVHFDRKPDLSLDIAFLACGDSSLEEQCLIAGEATAAIKASIRRVGI